MSTVPRILAWTRPPLQLAVMGLAVVGYLRNSVVIALAATALSAANRSQWPKTRWWLLVLILTVISLGASAACCTQACIRQREAAYRSILASYSEVLKVGMTRKEVEAYLERNGKPFRRTCCVAEWLGKNAWDDIVKIGKEVLRWVAASTTCTLGLSSSPPRSTGSGSSRRMIRIR